MPPVKIKTNGTSSIARPAERAILTFSVEDTGPDKALTSSKVLTRTTSIRDILKTLSPKLENGGAHPDASITHWSMGTLSTRSWIEYTDYRRDRDEDNQKRQRVFEASTDFTVKFKDFGQLSNFASELTSMSLVNIHGVEWKLTDKTKEGLVAQNRTMAAKDAMERAKDYARAFGLNKVTVAEIEEDVMGGRGFGVAAASAQVRYRGGAERGGGEGLSFHPQDVSISAAVTVQFLAE